MFINKLIQPSRLTPAYMTVVAFEAWFLYDMSSGPLWKYKCIDPAWFIACDVQMFLCAPLFMILLVNKRRLGVAMLNLAIVASVVVPFTLTYVYNLDPTIIADPSTLGHTSTTKTYLSTYITTYCRCGPYLVGMSAAHWLYNMRTNKANIGKSISSVLEWTAEDGKIGAQALIESTEGVVARILEWKMLRPFSRLSYSVFLVHTVVQMVHYAAIRSPEYMNNTRMFDAQNLNALTYRRGHLMRENYV
uniref:Uncharacterized protein n=1 Tax=Timema cristinae TaxID=61476 RepID=A0A7R9H8H5_TIMCR|nr:unnamed protein product [Timema cristinae]